MKTVFDNRMCAHVWAQQNQPYGRSNSMRFNGPVIYSYRTPIAAFTPEGAVLVTSNSYSPTTSSKHMPAVRRALRADVQVFTVPDVGYDGGMAQTVRNGNGRGWRGVHEVNLAWLVERFHAIAGAELRRNSWAGDDCGAERLADAHRTVADYCIAFSLTMPSLDMPAAVAKIRERRERLANDPKRKARAEQKAAREAERERLARLSHDEKLAEWLEGADVRLPYYRSVTEGAGAALRVKGDQVQTSWGASVPVADARRVLRLIDRERAKGLTAANIADIWPRSDSQLGRFTLDSFDEKGITAGCHFISWNQVERIRSQLEG